ncbi:MAG: DNA-3-methyladenine glycosylase 2 family protein [Selenomonas sp.]|uniref:DNA-3-methyladenine glycosylase family protein n=1 Tax=Selenomonas sp. TaxID=2053611 RepID=UPI0025D95492|nr:DNA-3-methyladenine glycosylase 2 family protein [Selenomonas sp.]MCI6084973.1 DNA-3-methyladenine glycosylase 2 family protein [Selenomonas sp.]MDY3297069.1 DNA-3-methyladenine glycosylase 2 family protein [Selenomonas sp.]MDY4414927.1 DNA-3-methyladenine glycosylase 2 family protein [Selenomonas sp.]
MFFQYDETATDYLKRKDKRLGAVIDALGHIDRTVDTDLFAAVVHHIIGQQISTKAQETLWRRMQDGLGEVTAETLLAAGRDRIQSFGTTFKKADYILAFAQRVHDGTFDIAAVEQMTDEAAIAALVALPGIGVWTAEMLLLFCLQRPNVLSYGDLAILRGMRMVYHHRKIDKKKFEMYRRRLSPYGSVASLYFWAVAGGAIPGMKDYAPKKKGK